MKRIVSVFAVLMMVAGMATAAPSLNGSNGLLRIVAADNCGPMTFGVGVHGMIWMKSETVGTIDTKNSIYAIVPGLNFAINDMFELSVAPVYVMSSRTYASFNTTTMALEAKDTSDNFLSDTRVALKASFKTSDMMCLGIYAGYDIPTTGEDYKPATDRMGTVHALVIPGFDFGAAKLDINVGLDYNLDKDSVFAGPDSGTAIAVYPNMAIPFGLGFSYKANDMFMPFIEISGSYQMDTLKYGKVTGYDSLGTEIYGETVDRGLMNNPLWITPGVRVSFPFGLHIDAAFDYNLQTKDSTLPGLTREQDWQIIAGLSYAACKASGPKVPPTGIISGKVVGKDGKGMAAMVMAGGITANTDPATGAYTLSGVLIDKAPVEIKADAKGYIAKQASIMLTKKNKKTPAMQDFTLELKPIPASDVTGMITNYKDGSPMAGATINFKGPKAVTAKTDAAGKYTAKLEQGNYQAVVSADGFKDKAFSVVAKDGKPAAQNIALVKQKETFAFADIYFPSGKATITPKAEAKLEGLYKVLSDNPELKVEIAGHTDALGSNRINLKLSQSRAEAVKTWLEAKGIAADKLVAKGYGEDKPIASNKTSAGRAENRRIEINVID